MGCDAVSIEDLVDRRIDSGILKSYIEELFGRDVSVDIMQLIRSGVRLIPDGRGGNECVVAPVGSLGGRPMIGDRHWPCRGGFESLEYIARLDLAVVAAAGVPLAGPSGLVEVFVAPLLDEEPGFYGDIADSEAFCFLPVDDRAGESVPPRDVYVHPRVAMQGVVVDTVPGWEQAQSILGAAVVPDWDDRFDELNERIVVSGLGEEFIEAPLHLIGGWTPYLHSPPRDEILAELNLNVGESCVVEHFLTIGSEGRAELDFFDGGQITWCFIDEKLRSLKWPDVVLSVQTA